MHAVYYKELNKESLVGEEDKEKEKVFDAEMKDLDQLYAADCHAYLTICANSVAIFH